MRNFRKSKTRSDLSFAVKDISGILPKILIMGIIQSWRARARRGASFATPCTISIRRMKTETRNSRVGKQLRVLKKCMYMYVGEDFNRKHAPSQTSEDSL